MINVGLYNIVIENDRIDSDLSDYMPWEMAYAMEAMISTHFAEGIDVTSNEYQQGILNAVTTLKNNIRSA